MELINKLLNGERRLGYRKGTPILITLCIRIYRVLLRVKLRSRKIVESVDSFKPNAKAGKVFRGLKPGQYRRQQGYR